MLSSAQLNPNLQAMFTENLYYIRRRELIGKIQEELSKKFSKRIAAAAYIANTIDPNVASYTAMNLSHLAFVDDLIRTASEGADAVALIIESYGGDADFPKHIIDRVREYSKEFYVIVVNIAKSAATLLAILSDKIIALETSSFGPVDPSLL